jgi:hypothetical protein
LAAFFFVAIECLLGNVTTGPNTIEHGYFHDIAGRVIALSTEKC